jgi:hypothetical protein
LYILYLLPSCIAHRCTKHPVLVLINARSAGSDRFLLSLIVRYCSLWVLHCIPVNLMHCMESMHTLHAFMNFYSLCICFFIFYNACSSITREASTRLVGGKNIIRSKLSSGVLLSRVHCTLHSPNSHRYCLSSSGHFQGRIQDFVWEGATAAHAQRSCRAFPFFCLFSLDFDKNAYNKYTT